MYVGICYLLIKRVLYPSFVLFCIGIQVCYFDDRFELSVYIFVVVVVGALASAHG